MPSLHHRLGQSIFSSCDRTGARSISSVRGSQRSGPCHGHRVPGPAPALAHASCASWWLGPEKKDSYIVAQDGDTLTIKVIQCTWNRRTQKYEAAVAADFAALGLRVKWQPFWSGKLQDEIEKARDAETKAGRLFDEGAFIASQREAELRRGTRG